VAVEHWRYDDMSNPKSPPRRVRVERNIYRTPGNGLEVGYRDSSGKQRWQRVPGATADRGIMVARAVRNDLLGRRGKGEHVQPNPKLAFGEAADRWLDEQVVELRPATQAIYRNAIDTHLRPRWGRRRLDTLTPDDAAVLVRELRAAGKSEWTIAGVLKAAGRVFRFAYRRMSWHGENPISALEAGERPKTGQTQRRRIYLDDELQQTLAAAPQPYRTLFSLAAVTGARLSELLGLRWSDVDMADAEAGEVRIEQQVDRKGSAQPLKTEESRRRIELPRSLAVMLATHRLAALADSTADGYVFATRTGRPLGQRNVMRALRAAQTKARDSEGRATFPVLHTLEEVPRGSVPSFHGFRHSAVSAALAAGEAVQEISWQLGHRNSVVTQTVYAQEIKSVERTARRRAAMEARYGSTLEALEGTDPVTDRADRTPVVATVHQLSQKAVKAN
jgi:integrase